MRGRNGKHRTATSLVNKETVKMNVPAKPNRRRSLGPLAILAIATALLATAFAAAPAQAAFGINGFDFTVTNEDGSTATQAGSHPYALTSEFHVNTSEPEGFANVEEEVKNLIVEQVPGLVGDAASLPRCSAVDFLAEPENLGIEGLNLCDDETAVGLTAGEIFEPGYWFQSGVWNLTPPPGKVVRFGFKVFFVPVIVDISVKTSGEYNVEALLGYGPQPVTVYGGALQLWGVPTDPAHDGHRGVCGTSEGFGPIEFAPVGPLVEFGVIPPCSVAPSDEPFLTLPRSCTGPEEVTYRAESWDNPGVWVEGSLLTHDNGTPQGFTGCGKLGFAPSIESKPTTDSAETGTGLDFNLDFANEGLGSIDGLSNSDLKKVEVTLPEGVTINPSVGEGLGLCTPAQLAKETVNSKPGAGCPNSSKVGSVHADLPVIEEGLDGSIFLAQQDDPSTSTPGAENPFDSLISIYFVFKNPTLGAMAKLPLLVEPDPNTGQLVVTVDDVPQFPLEHINVHLREGQRAPLVSPPACGTYTTKAVLTPWADLDNPRTILSQFEISEGVGGGACPPGGVPGFKPDFEAGSINNNAGAFSPFNMRLIRKDGEQNMTKFSSILPPGELGSLAGVSKCPDAAVGIAKVKTGREELAAPSCPANSLIGHTLAGAGVGGALTYVGGQVYLAGPYKGAPLSVISITPAVAGPFDAGTVVVRLALTLNPKTAEVEVDGAASDPIPHILKGIVLKVRDLRVYVDRPNFTLNPTSCDPSSAKAKLFGSFLNVLDPADDVPVDLATRYQAANCLNLGYKPKLNLRLVGGTKRGGHPGLRAIYTPRPGDANVEGLVVRLPRSAFLDQAHIRTICTRVQFKAESCPPGSRYGYIRAWTPLLDTPLEGPAYLRSSDNKLPDLVFDLQGLVDIEVATRIDSVNGGVRATLEDLPDAPISKVVLRMQGAKKGLIVNSRDLCARKSRANIQFTGQNGKQRKLRPVMRAQCGGAKGSRRAR